MFCLNHGRVIQSNCLQSGCSRPRGCRECRLLCLNEKHEQSTVPLIDHNELPSPTINPQKINLPSIDKVMKDNYENRFQPSDRSPLQIEKLITDEFLVEPIKEENRIFLYETNYPDFEELEFVCHRKIPLFEWDIKRKKQKMDYDDIYIGCIVLGDEQNEMHQEIWPFSVGD